MLKATKQIKLFFYLGPLFIGSLLCVFYFLLMSSKFQLKGDRSFLQVIEFYLYMMLPLIISIFLLLILPSTALGVLFINNLGKTPKQQNLICGVGTLAVMLLPFVGFVIYLYFDGNYAHGPAETAAFLLAIIVAVVIPLIFGLLAYILSFILNAIYFKKFRIRSQNLNIFK